jgi:uncharacterized damage-inducible protein DinB
MYGTEMFDHWAEARNSLYTALESLSDDQLAFTPGPGFWSPRETVCHIAGVEGGWVAIAAGEFDGWERWDFQTAGYPTPAALRSLLAEVHERTSAYLAAWDLAALDQPVALPWGKQTTRRWIIWHVLEHEIHHRGEIFLMMGMQGVEVPDI